MRVAMPLASLPLGIRHRLEEAPERVRGESNGDEAEYHPPEGLLADRSESTRQIGRASSQADRYPEREGAHDAVYQPLGGVPKTCETLDPRDRLLCRFRCSVFGFLLSLPAWVVRQACFLFSWFRAFRRSWPPIALAGHI